MDDSFELVKFKLVTEKKCIFVFERELYHVFKGSIHSDVKLVKLKQKI